MISNFLENAGNYIERHPEVFLVLAAFSFWHAVQYVKDYRSAVKDLIEGAEDLIHG